jgi:hypothetical protein
MRTMRLRPCRRSGTSEGRPSQRGPHTKQSPVAGTASPIEQQAATGVPGRPEGKQVEQVKQRALMTETPVRSGHDLTFRSFPQQPVPVA